MDSPVIELQDILDETFETIKDYINAPEYKSCFQEYSDTLDPSLKRYEHHQGENISNADLENRFRHESILLFTVTKILSTNSKEPNIEDWPIFEPNSPYRWLHLTNNSEYNDQFNDLITNYEIVEIPNLIHDCTEHLNKVTSRYLGEFYTPLSVAEHLVELSSFQAEHILNQKTIIDPACGGGIILWLVTKQFLQVALASKLKIDLVIELLSKCIYGYDIQPFAIILTRTILYFEFLQVYPKFSNGSENLFPNIRLQDSLLTYDRHWKEIGLFGLLSNAIKFDFIIANPPYMSLKKNKLDFIDRYEEVLYGHPNLYQLFLWWAINATNEHGMISFLIPQSMLTGIYFKELRAKIEQYSIVKSITRMIDRKGVVGEADIQMMVLALETTSHPQLLPQIDIRVVRNGSQISEAISTSVPYEKTIKKIDQNPTFWVVSDKQLDYEICELLESNYSLFEDVNDTFVIGNGGFVWNQHKSLLAGKFKNSYLPLVSAASLLVYGFEFPYTGSHAAHKRPYVKPDPEALKKSHRGQRILIQRTTPKKTGRRIVASILPEWFIDEHENYFLENHVNFIHQIKGDSDQLFGLLGWLNSDLINFIFQLRNGSTLVSLHELKLLPLSLPIFPQLSELVRQISDESCLNQGELIQEINHSIYEHVGLSEIHQERIKTVLAWKERS